MSWNGYTFGRAYYHTEEGEKYHYNEDGEKVTSGAAEKMLCEHPRQCVISKPHIDGVAHNNACGWCEAEARAEAAEAKCNESVANLKDLTAECNDLQYERVQRTGAFQVLNIQYDKVCAECGERRRERNAAIDQRNEYKARAEAAEGQLAEAQKGLDKARVVGIYVEFESIPDAVYQMARFVKDVERQLTEAQLTVASSEGALDGMRDVLIGCRKRVAELERRGRDDTERISELADIILAARLMKDKLVEAKERVAELEKLVPDAGLMKRLTSYADGMATAFERGGTHSAARRCREDSVTSTRLAFAVQDYREVGK